MINEEKKVIFIHVIKTGGASIERYFEAGRDHKTSLQYVHELGERQWQSYFKFTIVRNPWDKMVSQYHFNANKWVPEGTSFNEYIRLFSEGHRISTFSPFHLPYITNSKGDVIIDYIGRFEDLDKSMKYICSEIGSVYTGLPHINKSKHLKYQEYYNDESKNIISKMFAKEIDLFNYRF